MGPRKKTSRMCRKIAIRAHELCVMSDCSACTISTVDASAAEREPVSAVSTKVDTATTRTVVNCIPVYSIASSHDATL